MARKSFRTSTSCITLFFGLVCVWVISSDGASFRKKRHDSSKIYFPDDEYLRGRIPYTASVALKNRNTAATSSEIKVEDLPDDESVDYSDNRQQVIQLSLDNTACARNYARHYDGRCLKIIKIRPGTKKRLPKLPKRPVLPAADAAAARKILPLSL